MKKFIVMMAVVAFSALAFGEDAPAPAAGGDAMKTTDSAAGSGEAKTETKTKTTTEKTTKTAKKGKHKKASKDAEKAM